MHAREIQRIREYYEQPYANKLDTKRNGKILRNTNLPKPNQEETENLNRQIASKELNQ